MKLKSSSHKKRKSQKKYSQKDFERTVDLFLRKHILQNILHLLNLKFPQASLSDLSIFLKKFEVSSLEQILGMIFQEASFEKIEEMIQNYSFKALAYQKPRSEFDQAWKAVFHCFVFDFIKLIRPDLYSKIDLSKKPEDLSHELDAMYPGAETSDREADLLYKIWLLDGEEYYFLFHTEVQMREDPCFSMRMFEMWYRIRDKFHRPLFPIAITTFGEPQENRGFYEEMFETFGIRYEYAILNLLKYKDKEELQKLKDEKNPFSFIVEANLKAQDQNKDIPPTKVEWFEYVLHEIKTSRLTQEQKEAFILFVKWLIPLEPMEEAILVEKLEKKGEIPMYKSPTEQKVERKAKAEGKVEGKAETSVIMLGFIIPLAPEKIQEFTKRLNLLEWNMIDEFIAMTKNFKNENDVEQWIIEKEKRSRKNKAA